MSLLDPWRQARAEIIASRPTYTPFYTPGDYAVTVGNPDTGMVDQVAPEVLPQVVQRQNEVMDDGGGDDYMGYDAPQIVDMTPTAVAAAQPAGLLNEPNNPGFGLTYGTGQGPVVGPANPGGVTYDESGRAYAPALDPRDEPPSVLENLGFVTSKDTRGGGQYDPLGQSLTDPATQEAREQRDNAAMIARGFPFGSTIFGPMISGSRAGNLSEVGPYSRDAQGNFRYNALGPMGTLMAPVGELMDDNDFSGRYGLGTVGNTGISATPQMFDGDMYKGGSFGYGLGFKTDGTFGSLTASDVNDVQGMMDQGLIGTVGPGGSVDTSYASAAENTTAEDLDAMDADGGDVGGDDCVIATHGVKTGGFSERDKAKAEVWCQKKYHGKWWGELFREGYQYLGNRAIEAGNAQKYYGEFRAFIAHGRGLKPGLKHAINYYLRTVQFFATGAALTGVEQFQKLRKKINDLRNR